MAFTYSTFGQAEVMVIKLEPAAFLAAVEIEWFDRFAKVSEFAQEKMPPSLDAADPDRQLSQAPERHFAVWTVWRLIRIHCKRFPCALLFGAMGREKD